MVYKVTNFNSLNADMLLMLAHVEKGTNWLLQVSEQKWDGQHK